MHVCSALLLGLLRARASEDRLGSAERKMLAYPAWRIPFLNSSFSVGSSLSVTSRMFSRNPSSSLSLGLESPHCCPFEDGESKALRRQLADLDIMAARLMKLAQ